MKRFQRLISSVLIFVLALFLVLPQSVGVSAAEKSAVEKAIDKASAYMLEKGVSSEWEAIGLARAGKDVPKDYHSHFNSHVESQVVSGLETTRIKITDIERLAMAAVAIGKDPRDIDGLNLIEHIYNSPKHKSGTDAMTLQGNNGPVFALIALDTLSFDVPEDAKWKRQDLIAELLSTQNNDGSWALNPDYPDPSVDITAMALIGLSPYSDQSDVKDALDKAVNWLSSEQKENGGFDGGDFIGGITSEAASQVIIGLTAYGIDPTGERFTEDLNLIGHLLSYQTDDGGFMHTQEDGGVSNEMATEQALQGLVAYDLFSKGEGSLYDFPQIQKPEPNPSDPPEDDEEGTIVPGEKGKVNKGQTIKVGDSKTQVTMPADLPKGTELIVARFSENSNEPEGIEYAGDVFTFEFVYPDGEKVTDSYRLTMGFTGEEINKAAIYLLNEDTGKWEFVGGERDSKSNAITAKVDHFSTYGVFSDTVGPTDLQLTEEKTTSDSTTLGLSAYDPSGIEKYIVYIDGKEIAVVDGDDTKITDSKLEADQIYEYTVIAVDRLGNESEEVSVSVSTKETEDDTKGSVGDKDGNDENKEKEKNTNEKSEPERTETIDTTSNDDNVSLGGKDSNDNDKSAKLPATATNTFNLLLIGFVLLVVGSILLFVRKKRSLKFDL